MFIELYGLTVKCKAESNNFACQLIRPFKYFLKKGDGKCQVTIEIKETDPPYETFPDLKASFSTPRNIVYNGQDTKIIDYFGKGVLVEDDKRLIYTFYSCDRNFLQEAFYLLVISLFGQYCDRNGLLRIHALALAYNDTAILLPVPPGGGKSTMAMALLQEKDFKLISDDEPILDKSGYIHPFPLRIGTLDPQKVKDIPEKFVYKIDRMEFGPKYFIDCEYWEDRLEKRPLRESILFVSKRVLNGKPEIELASKRKILSALLRDAVVGVGLYQGVEFIFRSSPWEVLSKFKIVFKRFISAVKLTWRSKTFQITLTRDVENNVKVFKEFIRDLNDNSSA